MIQGESQLDGVSWGQSLLGDVASIIVSLQSLLCGLVLLVARAVLGNVAVVVRLHLIEENFTLACLGVGDQEFGK